MFHGPWTGKGGEKPGRSSAEEWRRFPFGSDGWGYALPREAGERRSARPRAGECDLPPEAARRFVRASPRKPPGASAFFKDGAERCRLNEKRRLPERRRSPRSARSAGKREKRRTLKGGRD